MSSDFLRAAEVRIPALSDTLDTPQTRVTEPFTVQSGAMDLTGVITTLFHLVNYVSAASKKMKQNREECTRFRDHADAVLTLLRIEVKDGAPADVIQRLQKLESTLVGLTSTLDALSNQSRLKRLLWREDISSGITRAYEDLSGTVELFNLGSKVDLRRFQRDNELARQADTTEIRKALERAERNGYEILEHLGIQDAQFEEAMIAIHNHLNKLEDSVERHFLQTGVHLMRSRSGPPISLPDAFDITSLDVNIYYHKKIGAGGCGEIYAADWRGTTVAVKVFTLDKGTPQDIFRKEIDIWKRLRHPNILEFFGACAIADPPFSVCALKSQGDAMKYLLNNPSADRGKIMYEASLGLDYLHGKSVVHADLKGSNILIDEHGTACICDFGLSKLRTHTTTVYRPSDSNYLRGTLPWMSPEQISLGITNKKSDIYSFGMTLYEVFSGRSPFADTFNDAIYTSVVEKRLRPPRPDDDEQIARGLTDALWALIEDCWAHDAEKRPSVQAVVLRLVFVLSARSSEEDAPSRTQRRLQSPSMLDVLSAGPLYLVDLTSELTVDLDATYGGSSRIYRGSLSAPQGQDVSVAIKVPHTHGCVDAYKGFIREAAIWLDLSHENVVPLLGVYLGHDTVPGLVSPFCEFGNAFQYVTDKSGLKRLEILVGVAEGLEYLPSRGIIHGDLKSGNVLINGEGKPWLCDFGSSAVNTQSKSVKSILVDFGAVASSNHSGTIRFMAPELLDSSFTESVVQDPNGLASHNTGVYGVTESSDVYAFSMTALEIYSARMPFFYIQSERAVALEVHKGGRPNRSQYEPPDCPPLLDNLWELLGRCWHPVPGSRPTIALVVHDAMALRTYALQLPRTHAIYNDNSATDRDVELIGIMTDNVQQSPDRSDASSPHHVEMPPVKDLTGRITGIDPVYFDLGGFSEIYKGWMALDSGETLQVAVKILRGIHTNPDLLETTTKRLYRETLVWQRLCHPNILPFYGICRDTGLAPSVALISALCENGNVMAYVHAHVDVDRREIVLGTAQGLGYLHSCGVVHGDLKPSNVLIDDDGVPRICDFGRSRMIDHSGFTTGADGGSRLTAPELLAFDPGESSDAGSDMDWQASGPTNASDIYAFSMLSLEILTGRPPFYWIKSTPLVYMRVMTGHRPDRGHYDVPEKLWRILEDCWKQNPEKRPRMTEVVCSLV